MLDLRYILAEIAIASDKSKEVKNNDMYQYCSIKSILYKKYDA